MIFYRISFASKNTVIEEYVYLRIMVERLQKIISRYGVASRRSAEQMILAARVSVNGLVVTELGTKFDPEVDRISIDGKLIVTSQSPKLVYLLLHKPLNTICSRHDPQNRPTIQHLLPDHYQHLYSIGRLDYNSTGALLLTNDGDLANQLTHPKHHIAKTYEVLVQGNPSLQTLQQWRSGVELDGKQTLAAEVSRIEAKSISNQTLLRVVLHEGRNRQIRRVAEQLGHPVVALHRVSIDNIPLGSLPPGKYRLLTSHEVQQICSH